MDPNKIATLEYQIGQKYGQDVVQHPRSEWNEDDDIEFDKQVDKLYEKFHSFWGEKSYTNKSGYLVSEKLFSGEKEVQECEYCSKYRIHFTALDDVSIGHYGCCYECYVNYIEDREDRWESGWRPNKEDFERSSQGGH